MESSSGRKEIFPNDFLVTIGQCRSQLNPVLFSFYSFSIKLPPFRISKSLSILSQLSIRIFSQVKNWGTCLDWVSCVFKALIYDGDTDSEPPEKFCSPFQQGEELSFFVSEPWALHTSLPTSSLQSQAIENDSLWSRYKIQAIGCKNWGTRHIWEFHSKAYWGSGAW